MATIKLLQFCIILIGAMGSPINPNWADSIERGFSLAYFIFPDRETAIEILKSALNKLNSRIGQERKRAYWRDKFLSGRITRITRDNQDTLQWLIYLESDSHEKAEEGRGEASHADMVVRFIKALVRLSIGLSSFYVNIAVHRLLYCYTTADAQRIYEFVTDYYREGDEYRRAKRLLMMRLGSRFGDHLRTMKGDHGETRYELADSQEPWRDLVMNSLQMFTPWSTEKKCLSQSQFIALGTQFHERIMANCEEGDNQDKIEVSRCHVFIDPLCCRSVVQELGLEPHFSKLGLPRFHMDPDRNQRPHSRLPDGPLTSQERRAISDTLSEEEKRRRKVVARELRFVVDGIERGHLDVESSRKLCFEVPFASEWIEIWTQDEHGPLLLATQVLPRPEARSDAESFELRLKGGARVSVLALRDSEDKASSLEISAEIVRKDRSAATAIRDWLAQASALPAYASMLLLLLAMTFVWMGLERKLANERLTEDELRVELARKQTAPNSSGGSQTLAAAAVYRLTPDDLIPRGASAVEGPEIRVPAFSSVIELKLPVPDSKHQYSATVSFLKDGKRIVTEESLVPVNKPGETTVTLSLPSSLLVSAQYYRVQVHELVSGYVRTFTFYTASAQP